MSKINIKQINNSGAAQGSVVLYNGTTNKWSGSDNIGILVPSGTTLQRPTTTNGLIRYNTTTGRMEFCESNAWHDLTLYSAHSSLSGLTDDDHAQYVHISVARTISAVHTFSPSIATAPFILAANAQTQLVTGLNADLLDGQHASAFQPINSNLTSLAADVITGLLTLTATGSVTSRTIVGASGQIEISNGDGVFGNPTISLSETGIVSGGYNNVSVDIYGRVVSGSNTSYLTANQPITLSGDVSGSGTTTILTTLASVGIAGTYTKVTTDAKGRVISGTTLAITDIPQLTKSKISDFVESNYVHTTGNESISGIKTFNNDVVISGNLTISGTNTIINTTSVTTSDPIMTLASSNTGTSPYIGLLAERGANDAFWVWEEATQRWVSYTSVDDLVTPVLSDVQAATFYGALSGNASTATKLATARTISITTDATGSTTFDGSANAVIALTLANVATAGTYKSVTINAKGLVISGTNPTTLAGYGITDAQPLNSNLTALSNQSTYGLLSLTSSGTLTQRTITGTVGQVAVVHGDGVTGDPTISLVTTGVSAGTYNNITVDTYGRATSGSNISYLTSNQNITVSGDVSGSGTTSLNLVLNDVGTAGTYTKVTTDSKGRVISGTTLTASDIPSLTKAKISDFVEGDYVHIAGTETVTGSKTFSADTFVTGNITTSGTNTYLDSTNVALASSILTLSRNNTTASIQYNGLKVERGTTDSFFLWDESIPAWTAYTSTNNLTSVTLADFSAANFIGHLTGNADTATKLQTARTISISNDATGSASFDGTANANIAITLANSGVVAGTYKSVTVNSKGLVTNASNPTTLAGYGITDAQPLNSNLTALSGNSTAGLVTLTSTGNITSRTITGTASQISVTNGDGVLGNPTISLIATGVTAGTYNNITVDSYGLATVGTNVSYITGNQTITLSGDTTGSGTTAITTTLASVGTAGTYTKVTTDAKGRVVSGTTLSASDIPSLTKAKISDFVEGDYVHITGDETIGGNKTFSNNVTVVGNFTVQGTNTTITTTNVTISDPVMVLASANSTATAPYIGLKGERGTSDTFWVWNEATQRWTAYTSPDDLTTPTLGNVQAANFYGALVGNADTATKLATARTISITTDATGSATFDGSSNATIAVTLANVATAGTYKSVTINSKGLVTSGTNPTTLAGFGITDAQGLNSNLTSLSINTTGGMLVLASTGNIVSRTISGTTGRISVTNGNGVSGNPTIDLSVSGVTAGTYNNITVDVYGRATLGSNVSYLTGNQTISITGDGTGSGTTSIPLTLANTGVTAGTYKSVTVNAKGLVTAATNPTTLAGYGIVDAQPLNSNLTSLAADATTGIIALTAVGTIASRTITGTSGQISVTSGNGVGGNPTIGLTTTGVTAGTYNNLTVDVYGRVSSGSTVAYITGNQTITLSGDTTGSGTTAITTTLAAVGTAGTYTKVTTDAKGRVISGTTLVAADIPLLTKAKISDFVEGDYVHTTGNETISGNKTFNNDVTVVGNFTVQGTNTVLNTTNITVSDPVMVLASANSTASVPYIGIKGERGTSDTFWVWNETTQRWTAYASSDDLTTKTLANIEGSNFYGTFNGPLVGNADTATKLATARTISITTDATGSATFDGSANATIALTLANSGVTAGTYKSVTVNAKGLVTAGSNPTTLAGYGITDAQPLNSNLTALSSQATYGMVALTGAGAVAARTITGTASQISVTNGNGISGNPTIALLATGVTAGTYNNITVDAYGRATVGSNVAYITGNQTITATGDVTGSGTTTLPLTLASVGTAGTYTKVTTDAKGRVISGTTLVASDIPLLTKAKISDFVEGDYVHTTGNETIGGTKTFSNDVVISGNLTIAGTNTTINTTQVTTTDPILTLASGNSGATQPYIGLKAERGTTDAFWVWNESTQSWTPYTSGDDLTTKTVSNITATTFNGALSGNATTATALATARTISLSTDATGSATFDGSANATIAVTLATVATAGTYKSVTINAKGLVTSGTNPTTLAGYGITDAQPLNSNLTSIASNVTAGVLTLTATGNIVSRTITGTAGQITVTNGNGVSGSPTISLASSGVTTGTYNNVTVDTYGRVTSGSNASYITGNQTITLSGDVSGSGTTAITTTLANSGVAAGTYQAVTVNAKGIVTAGSNPTTLSGYGIVDAQPLNSNLTSLAADTTPGMLALTATGTVTSRTIAGTTNQITVTNGDGVAGAPTIAMASNAVMPGTGGVVLPTGTTAQRPASPTNGTARYNTDLAAVEYYQNGAWVTVSSSGTKQYVLYADQFDNPVTSNWAVNRLAPASLDSTNNAFVVRAFDDTLEEGVGWSLTIPSGVTSMTLYLKHRCSTAPATAKAVILKLYDRTIPNNAAITAWSNATLSTITTSTNAYYQYTTIANTLATLGLTAGTLVQFELTRNGASASDTLVGDWLLYELIVEFS